MISVSIPLRSDFNIEFKHKTEGGEIVSIPLRSDFNCMPRSAGNIYEFLVSIPLRSDFNRYMKSTIDEIRRVSIPLRSDFNMLSSITSVANVPSFNPSKV